MVPAEVDWGGVSRLPGTIAVSVANVVSDLGDTVSGLMHLRLGVVQWAVFVFLLITHSVSEDVPAFRLKPELQTYLSLEFTL